MSLAVIAPGVFTTVQDLGRDRFRSWGVPIGGAFDLASAMLANALLDNSSDCAVLEMTHVGGVYEAKTVMALALAGAPMRAQVRPRSGSDTPIVPAIAFSLKPFDQLVIEGTPTGVRTYLAVKGGWQTPEILGSRSSEIPLKRGDDLPCLAGSMSPVRRREDFRALQSAEGTILRLIDAPDAGLVDIHWLDPEHFYTVGAQSDRMGIRLQGQPCEAEVDPERLSTPVAPGAVQIAGGLPLILGVACGTMGGYPHVAQILSADLPRLAQARVGEKIHFERVSVAEGRRISLSWRRDLRDQAAIVRAFAADRIG